MAATPWLQWAIDQIGTREAPGSANNPEIVRWGQEIGLDWYVKDSTAWCAVFVNFALHHAGLPGTASALAQSFRDYGTRLSEPVPGAIFVMPRGSKSWQGHTGIVEVVHPNGTFTAVDGNVSDQVKRTTYRTAAMFKDGFRWPAGAEMTPEAKAAAVGEAPTHTLGDRLLRRGDQGPDVEDLQADLDAIGLMDNNPETAVFGPDTEDAVRAFQRRQGLVIDGIAGPATVGALTDAVAKSATRKTIDQTAKEAAAPAALGAAGVAGTAAVVVDVVRQTQSLNDGTMFGAALAGVVLLAIVGFVGYRFLVKRSADNAMADFE